MTKDEKYISRCLQLAYNGLCNTAPNPMVGAVIVYHDTIIGEGYHIRCGEAHAEVNAIRSVKDENLLKESTIYVSLEPCSHYGKTPPCADLIIERKAGIEVTVGVLEEECRHLIRRFITFNTFKRPYITLKWAESADGFIDINRTGGKPIILSNPLTSMLVHKKRAEHDAILVGRHTALLDNPSLSTRNWYGKHPVRLVIDKELTLPRDLELFNGKIKTFVFTRESPRQPNALTEYISLDFNKDILPQIMEVLYQKKIQSLLVEGGSILLQSFIDSGLWDEAFIEKAPLRLNNGIQAPSIQKKHFKLNKIYFGREIMHAVHSQIQR